MGNSMIEERLKYYEQKKVENDAVNHPDYYKRRTSIECIDVMIIAFGEKAVIDFCICNAFKYMWRYEFKNGEEDLEKAKWYIAKARELILKKSEEFEEEWNKINSLERML